MGSLRPHARYTLEEYLRLEEYANVKHEWVDGQIFAMAGGTPEHAAMAARIIAALSAQLADRPCAVYSSDVRIRVTATGLDTYPDVSVVCGGELRDEQDRNALTNPVALVEVLSASTEEYDRGEKLEHYKQIESLCEVLLVSYRDASIELVSRKAAGASWTTLRVGKGESLDLVSIGCVLQVDAVYRDPFAR